MSRGWEILSCSSQWFSRHAFGFRVILAGAVLLYLVSQTDVRAVLGYFDWASLGWLVLVQPVVILALAMAALRLAVLVATPPVPFVLAFKAVIVAHGTNLFLPGRLSELLKATYLRNQAGIPLSVSLSALILERLVDVVFLVGLGIASLGAWLFEDRPYFYFLVAIAVFSPLVLPNLEGWLLRKAPSLPSRALRDFAIRFVRHSALQFKTGVFYKSAVYGIVGWGFAFLSVYVLLNAVGSVPVDFSGAISVFVLSTIGGSIPALPGGFGTYEAAAVFALQKCGYGVEEAISVAVVLHVSQLILSAGGTLFIAGYEHLGIVSLIRDIKALAKKHDKQH